MIGYFEIGIYQSKTPVNLGTLWRSAYQLGASSIFIIGNRFPLKYVNAQTTDILHTYKHIPLRQYTDFKHFLSSKPIDCSLIGIEITGCSLTTYKHPERAVYILGSEDKGLPSEILEQCDYTLGLKSVRTESYNVAIAGSIVMYHRQFLSKGINND